MNTRLEAFIRGKRFPGAFVGLLLLITAYVTIKVTQATEQMWGVHPRFTVFLCLMAISALVAYSQQHLRHNSVYRVCACITSYYLCYMVYFLMILAVGDVICRVTHPGAGWQVYAEQLVGIAGLSALALVVGGTVHARKLRVKPYTLRLGDTGAQYHMVLLSDLHLGTLVQSGHIRKMAREVNGLHPDMVVITGDLFDGKSTKECPDLERVTAALRQLRTKDGVYAVLGNHDPDVSDPDLTRFLKDSNIKLLYNSTAEFPLFTMAGRMGLAATNGEERTPLTRLLSHCDRSKPVVVLDHDPQGIREAETVQADLVLCGHTHRGQFFPMNLFTKLSLEKGFYYGYTRRGKTQAVISAGTGFHQMPIRIGSDSEIVDLHLHI